MVNFDPKLQFQGDTDRRKRWAIVSNDPLFHTAVTHALAVMVNRGLSPDALAGVNGFITVLLNLSEEPIEQKPLPIRRLTSYDPPTTTTPPQPT